jgi:hypothetical protein
MSEPLPNPHGVYAPTETLTLPNTKANWRGAHLAEIDLLRLSDGWRSAIGAMLSVNGRCEPITIKSTAFPTREAAIADGVERLRLWLDYVDDPQAPAVRRWLDSLIPDGHYVFDKPTT